MRRLLVLPCALGAVAALALASTPQQAAHAGAACETTVPNGVTPPGESQALPWHGDGTLWTTVPNSGRLGDGRAVIDDDGSTRVKHPWWRGVAGRVVVTGTRLDASAPALVARVFPEGYGETGFQPSSIWFPTRGCWRVTGTLGDDRLTIVVEVTVGRETAPVPRAALLRPRRARTGALIRWRRDVVSWSVDLRVRRAGAAWKTVLRRSYAHGFLLRGRTGVFDVAVRAADRFGPGPWSSPRRIRLG